MIVQIFEPFGGGHHTKYIRALLPALIRLREQGYVRKVVVTTSAAHRDSPAFRDQLAHYAADVDFDVSLPPFVFKMNASGAIAGALLDSVARVRPDYLISTTADIQSVALASRAVLRARSLPKSIHSVGIFHAGYGDMAQRPNDRLKDAVYRFAWRFSPWSQVHTVNPMLYESLEQRERDAGRLRVLPHPVERLGQIDKAVARRTLGIPVEGRYIGCIGTGDRRKAIPELLHAFRAAASGPRDRFLLAGRLEERYRALIAREFFDLVRAGRLIVIDRYLTTAEHAAGLCAVDVCAVVYYPKPGLSANLLEAACAGRPVVAGACGYTGMAVERFGLGWTCDVRNRDALAATIRTALAESVEYRAGAKVARLLAFHDPENYAGTVLGPLYERAGLPPPQTRTWEWAQACA